jgi:hypothetical protein
MAEPTLAQTVAQTLELTPAQRATPTRTPLVRWTAAPQAYRASRTAALTAERKQARTVVRTVGPMLVPTVEPTAERMAALQPGATRNSAGLEIP